MAHSRTAELYNSVPDQPQDTIKFYDSREKVPKADDIAMSKVYRDSLTSPEPSELSDYETLFGGNEMTTLADSELHQTIEGYRRMSLSDSSETESFQSTQETYSGPGDIPYDQSMRNLGGLQAKYLDDNSNQISNRQSLVMQSPSSVSSAYFCTSQNDV